MLKTSLTYLFAGALCLSSLAVMAAGANETTDEPAVNPQSLRVMSVDWSQTETLLALGITPIASAQQADYNAWVKSPRLPDSTVDVGLRNQPNVERLAELDLDTIFLSPRFASLEPQLSKITAVKILGLYKVGEVDWSAVVDFTRRMASQIDALPQAERLITRSENRLSELKQRLPANLPPVVLVQFMDSKHVRVFGDNSIYQVALDQLGIENGWQQATNAWGFALTGVDKLQGLEGQIVVVDPLPLGVKAHLNTNQYWQYLVRESGHPALSIDAVWSFGSMLSAVRFAELLSAALMSSKHVEENKR